MRLGVYGGTFDPLHVAHLIIAEFAREKYSLDKILFVPSYIPPHKRSREITPAKHRLAMLGLGVEGNDFFDICDYEIRKKGTSYTVDTLNWLRQKYHLTREMLFLIIGADNMVDFHLWKQPEQIVEMAQLVVAGRPNYDKSSNRFKALALDAPLLEISASSIRAFVKQGRSIKYLTPPAVEAYIQKHKLYL